MTAIGGSVVSRASPQVIVEVDVDVEEQERDRARALRAPRRRARQLEPQPDAEQRRRRRPSATPTPRSSTMKWNGENWISASKPGARSMPKSSKPSRSVDAARRTAPCSW